MPLTINRLLQQYILEIRKIYGDHVKQIILYGSYARGDYNKESDIDIMILLDVSDLDIKAYFNELADITYDFNLEYEVDVKPIAKNQEHFKKWMINYPFYANVAKEGVTLYEAA